jgi:glycerol-3-phosphate dehydrogenase
MKHRPERSQTLPPTAFDVCIIGGGVTGLWAAVEALGVKIVEKTEVLG